MIVTSKNILFASMIFFFICFSSYGFSANLSFHQVITICNQCDRKLYFIGKKIYKKYRLLGLSDDFLIKKNPDFLLERSDITKIIIRKIHFIKSEPASYTLVVILSQNSSNKFEFFTKTNIGKVISIQIGDNVIQLVKIINEISGKISVPLTEPYNVYLEDLERLTDNIYIED